MIYREFQGMQLSMLGLGTMRLPLIDGDNAKIDEKATAEMVDYAMEHGIKGAFGTSERELLSGKQIPGI